MAAIVSWTSSPGEDVATISQKVAGAGASVFLLAAALAGAGIWVSGDFASGLKSQSKASAVLRAHMEADMMHDALHADVLSAQLVTMAGVGSISDVHKALSEHADTFRKAVAQSRAGADDAEVKQVLDGMKSAVDEYVVAADEAVSLFEASNAAGMAAMPEFEHKFKVLEGLMDKAGDVIESRDAASTTKAAKQAETAKTAMFVLLGLAAAFSGALVYLSRSTIVGPIQQLTADMRKLASGDIDIELKGASRTDEVGDIGRAVRAFQDVITRNAHAEAARAEAARKIEAERETEAGRERLARAQAQQAVVETLANGLDRLANGDLVCRINSTFPNEYERLRHDFNAAVDRLHATVSGFVHAVSSVQTGVGEIGSATNDLSRRTEQQAAALEETAAALDEITATVRKTASGAGDTSRAVQGVRQEAVTSGAIVREAVEAMGQIDSSSSKISQIIGVIDEIAFQTNLLALNAGVEAARAGEAGRGFAVVATEVRALAQRSADAAREIKALISESGEQVGRGVNLVGQAGAALEQILQRVAHIADLTEEIASSAQEQAVGLDQVNRAVNQMDQVTQQNAAMVEQTTAASHSLMQETDSLFDLASRFTIQQAGERHLRAAG